MRQAPKISCRYAYASTRVKAMKSNLIGEEGMKNIMNAKSLEEIISQLSQTDYKIELEQFGGMKISSDYIDFALSENLAKNVGKLIKITPAKERDIIRAIFGRWDIYNIELAIDAKASGKSFDDISKYIINYGPHDIASIKEALSEESMENMILKLMNNSPYKKLLREALEIIRGGGDALQANTAIDRLYYQGLAKMLPIIKKLSQESFIIINYDMEMRNILVLIRAKKYGLSFEEIEKNLIISSNLNKEKLEAMYKSAKDEIELARGAKDFDLTKEIEDYEKNRKLLVFEIGMQNQILKKSVRLLGYTLLSFGTIIAYAYIKEIEVLNIRILAKGMQYNLNKEDLSKMIVWKN
ncbi:MAG: V-type ATPase subunit [Candidatus Micrarchaeia archaeon]